MHDNCELSQFTFQPKKNNKTYTPKVSWCDICGKEFCTPINLINHKLAIHEHSYPYACNFPSCNKKYVIESRLKLHMLKHNPKFIYKCSLCGKEFIEKGNYKTHLKFHSSLRPFLCTLCPKSYKTKGHLKEHIDVQHQKIKKFFCDVCSRSFGRHSSLKVHLEIHKPKVKIKCSYEKCNKYFTKKGNMLMHYKRHIKDCKPDSLNIDVNSNLDKIYTAWLGKGNELNELESAITRPCSNSTLFNTMLNNQICINENTLIISNNPCNCFNESLNNSSNHNNNNQDNCNLLDSHINQPLLEDSDNKLNKNFWTEFENDYKEMENDYEIDDLKISLNNPGHDNYNDIMSAIMNINNQSSPNMRDFS